eukprot:scaffold130817_cov45-Prasinocladus_malaysianus.AAC.1
MDEDCALLSPREWGTQWVDAACGTKASCVCEGGAALSSLYTEQVIQELKKGDPIGYEQCDEGNKASRKTRWFLVLVTALLVAVLGTNVYVILLARRIQTVQKQAYREGALQQSLVEYDSLCANGNNAA